MVLGCQARTGTTPTRPPLPARLAELQALLVSDLGVTSGGSITVTDELVARAEFYDEGH